MSKSNRPYTQEILESGIIKRVFDANTDSHELTWHRDKKDRLVTVVNESDWMIQFDNDLPKKLIIGESVIIPKETYHRVIKGDSNLVVEIQEFDSLDEAKKKGEGKKDACYHKVKSRYKVWPSAYGSGALVQCRKVGAANWGNKSEDVEVLEPEGDGLNYNDYEVHDRLSEKTDYSKEKSKGIKEDISAKEAYTDKDAIQTVLDGKRNLGFITLDVTSFPEPTFWKIIKNKKKYNLDVIEVPSSPYRAFIYFVKGYEKEANELKNIAEKYGGFLSYRATEEETRRIGELLGYKQADIDNYIIKNYGLSNKKTLKKRDNPQSGKSSLNVVDENTYEVHDRLSEKTDYSKEKSKGLHGWFERRGGEGSQGWVDCNTCRKDPDTGRKKCKPCGRKEGEERAKYPSCRPTPSACKTKGKGEKWGKKSENTVSLIKNMLKEFVESEKIDEMIGIYRYEKDERMSEPAIVEPEVKPDVERTPKRRVGDSPFIPPAKRPSTKPKANR